MKFSSIFPFARTPISAALACSLLASCGGGGGSPTPSPSPTNSAPAFTSSAAVSVSENETDSFYTATASDVDQDVLNFSIGGGADSARFQITADGRLSFVEAPNFEDPDDADENNVYQITLSVSDGRATANLSLSVQVNNVADAARLTRISTGLGEVVSMSATQDQNLIIIADSDGILTELDPAGNSLTSRGNIFESEFDSANHKLITLSPSGDYADSREVFALFERPDGLLLIDRFIKPFAIWFSNTSGLFAEATTPGIADRLSATSALAPDGSVYFLAGDAGQPSKAQEDGISGNIVRAFRNPDPFSGASVRFFLASLEGRGLHNPTGGSFVEGDLIFSDAGDIQFDEFNRFTPSSADSNYGWPFVEGRETVANGAPGNLIDPLLAIDRGTGAGARSPIVAGHYYEGPILSLHERFVSATEDGKFYVTALADLADGAMSNSEKATEVVNEFQTDNGVLNEVVAIAMANSILFVLDADGEVYRVDLETV